MTTLTEFLRARLDEDEAVARQGDPADLDELDYEAEERWSAQPHGQDCGHRMGERLQDSRSCRYPARVLADIEAKRAIVDWHENWPVLVETQPEFVPVSKDVTSMTFRMTQQIAWLTNREYVARFGTEPPTAPVLRMLAQPYADHPDYNPAWRP